MNHKKSRVVGPIAFILILFGMGLLNLITDSVCFPQVFTDDNMGYGILILIFRPPVLIIMSIITAATLSVLLRGHVRSAGILSLISGAISAVVTIQIGLAMTPDLPSPATLYDLAFPFGFYTVWATLLVVVGIVLLIQSTWNKGATTHLQKSLPSQEGVWPPPPHC